MVETTLFIAFDLGDRLGSGKTIIEYWHSVVFAPSALSVLCPAGLHDHLVDHLGLSTTLPAVVVV
jgi:hypothetical protein